VRPADVDGSLRAGLGPALDVRQLRPGRPDRWHADPVPVGQPPPLDEVLLTLLQRRDGVPSDVVLRDGTRLTVFNIAWGYDLGDQFAHVTTNVSPDVSGAEIGIFCTADVSTLVDPETGAVLYERPAASGRD
jgi:hypothetical protein